VDEIGKKFFNITENFSKFFGWEKFGHNYFYPMPKYSHSGRKENGKSIKKEVAVSLYPINLISESLKGEMS
jgi:hypothetical protein